MCNAIGHELIGPRLVFDQSIDSINVAHSFPSVLKRSFCDLSVWPVSVKVVGMVGGYTVKVYTEKTHATDHYGHTKIPGYLPGYL
jgi:hypothetical protein